MTPKETVQVIYDAFASGDMEKFASVFSEDCICVMNGMHAVSGTYHGRDAVMTQMMARVGKHFPDGVAFEKVKMFAEGNNVFTMGTIKADGLEMSVGHHHVVEDGKVKEMHIFDDSQKWAMTLKPM